MLRHLCPPCASSIQPLTGLIYQFQNSRQPTHMSDTTSSSNPRGRGRGRGGVAGERLGRSARRGRGPKPGASGRGNSAVGGGGDGGAADANSD